MEQNGRYAWVAKMGTKGQIVIPAKARELFNFKPGDNILILADVNEGLAIVDGKKFENIYEIIKGEKQK